MQMPSDGSAQEGLDPLADRGLDGVAVLATRENQVAGRVLGGEVEEVRPDALVELCTGRFKTVEVYLLAQGPLDRYVEQHGEVGDEPARCPIGQAADLIGVERSARALVGDHRVHVPVADDDLAG